VNWRERARTPRGQAQFLLALFAAAALASVGLGLARPFFEGFVRERYPQPSVAAIRLADAAALGSATPLELRELSPEDFDGVYRAFMRQDPEVAGAVDGQRGDELPPPPSEPLLEPGPLGRLLFAADPERASALLRRTLIVGSPAQRERALLLTREVRGSTELSALLDWAWERAERTRDPQAALLARAAAQLTRE
tara:strand:- start:84 stop:668 length:585 start_codon:yes stop_codon:yes gene_type:complete